MKRFTVVAFDPPFGRTERYYRYYATAFLFTWLYSLFELNVFEIRDNKTNKYTAYWM